MILGVGIDIAEVSRFQDWPNYKKESLLKVFTLRELKEAALESGHSRLEFYASRFAAKEAFYKALAGALVKLGLTEIELSFEFARKNVEVAKESWGVPLLEVNWVAFEEKIGKKLPSMQVDFSLSHEKNNAVAIVLLSKVQV